MRLYEFVEPAEDEILASSIIAVANQLKQSVEKGKIDPDNFTVTDLLDLFQINDITIDVEDLYTMIKKPLLKGVIANIQGDKVVFKGHEPVSMNPDEAPDEKEKTVAKMAKSAMKKPSEKNSVFQI